jgi:hypothetical protein
LAGDFGRRLRPATSASDFGRRLRPATSAGDFGRGLQTVDLVAGGHSFCLFFIYSYIHSFNHIHTIHLSGNLGRQLWPATFCLFFIYSYIHSFDHIHKYIYLATWAGDFGGRLRPATSAGDFGRRLQPATSASDFGRRLWPATLPLHSYSVGVPPEFKLVLSCCLY